MNKTMFSVRDLEKIYKPAKESHKGQNGKLSIIGGSQLFHGASLWALKVASRIVDMVFYSSIKENNALTQQLKSQLYDFIAIPRAHLEEYLAESDAILIGPGMPREEGRAIDEEPTRELTKRLLAAFSHKRWIIDAGALQTMDPEWLLQLEGRVILTPHPREFEILFHKLPSEESVADTAKKYNSIILLKGEEDIISSSDSQVLVKGGNEGMTKGGTGDVLAGLVAALACKNDMFLSAQAASFINKKASDDLYKTVGPYFNASDLVGKIPVIMNQYIYK